jgi:hypothetical protein
MHWLVIIVGATVVGIIVCVYCFLFVAIIIVILLFNIGVITCNTKHHPLFAPGAVSKIHELLG